MVVQLDSRACHAMAVYELTVSDGEFEVAKATTSLPFDLSHYSEFKYGRRDIAEEYGIAIAHRLMNYFTRLRQPNEPIVVTGTPYKRVPNAARMLAITAERHLRKVGFASSYASIYQHRLAEGDYGTLSTDARDQRNKDKKRSFDPDDFAGKHVVLIDDIRITGSIERSTLATLADVPMLSMVVVNLVRLDPEVALREPHLEDKLNHSAVKGLSDLLRLMNQPERFVLTTRAVKYILQSDPADVHWFLEQLGSNRTLELYEAIVDDGYDRMSCYDQVFYLVRRACSIK